LLDNRYVPGSSTPIVRRDSEGNTYQVRQLADGSVCEVLKNFPTRAALTATLGADAIGLRIADFEYYWGASYQTSGPA
jgi:demethylmenaquinone methyltransferase/2-methoxy-6-polyprenyl-1,4-benzoquinol methylase